MAKLPPETDINDLRMAFILMDSDNDGRVTALEIQNMLSSLGIILREEIVVNLVRQASQSGWLFSYPLDLKRKIAPSVTM